MSEHGHLSDDSFAFDFNDYDFDLSEFDFGSVIDGDLTRSGKWTEALVNKLLYDWSHIIKFHF